MTQPAKAQKSGHASAERSENEQGSKKEGRGKSSLDDPSLSTHSSGVQAAHSDRTRGCPVEFKKNDASSGHPVQAKPEHNAKYRDRFEVAQEFT